MPTPLPYLRRVWFDLLGRGPRRRELRFAERMDPPQLVRSVVKRKEFFEWWYEEELYYFLLLDNFRPRAALVEAIPERLARGRITVRDAVQEIVISTGFSQRNPGPDTFVTVVLEQLLGVTVQKKPRLLATGKKIYDGYPAKIFKETGRSQADLVAIAIRQPGFADRYMRRHVERLLGKAMDPNAMATHTARFRAKPQEYPAIMADVVLSAAYRDALSIPKAKTDHQFLRGLYTDLLDRVPTQDELRRLRNAMQALADSRPIRSVLVRMILDSGQAAVAGAGLGPKAAVEEMFQRFFARPPTQKEAATFVAMLEKRECDLAQASRALLTSPEYQYY